MTIITKKLVTLVVGVGVLAIGALSAAVLSPGSAVDEPSIGFVSTITEPGQITLPLDDYTPSRHNVQVLEHGVYAAVGACMANFGFDYDAPAWYLNESGMFARKNGQFTHDRLFGLIDMAQAEHSGYHLNLIPAQQEKADAEQKWQHEHDLLASHSRGYLNVMGVISDGGTYVGRVIPDGGCFQEGKRQVEGASTTLVSMFESIGGEAWHAASSDSRVKAVFEKWSACMDGVGFNFDTPWAANNDAGGADVTDAEIATAVADVRCKQQTNLVGVYAAVDAAYQRALIDKHSDELHAAQASFASAVDRASALIQAD